jgi:hypothetical protein
MSSSRASRVVFATLVTVSLSVACAAGSSSSSSGALPECAAKGTPKQGAGVGPAYTFSQLPSGACSSEPSCALSVFGPCFNNPEYVGYPLNGYQCDCKAGTWSCFVKNAGLSACGPPLVDGAAPVDAGDGGVR